MWSSGERIVLRYRSVDGRFLSGRPLVVVEDGPDLLVAYLPRDTIVSIPVLADGRGLRDVALDERWAHPRARLLRPWRANDVVMLFPRGRAHSLWVFRDGPGAVRGWYVNLEDPHVRTARTLDTRDGILDIWVPARTGEPQWKDEDELEAATRAGRVTPEEARAIRAEGERVVRERPWPTGWEDYAAPDAARPELPPGWYAGPLETARLTLVPFAPEDLADSAVVYGSEAQRELDDSTAAWAADEAGFWALHERRGGAFVGVAETHRAGEGLEGIAPDELEIGWVVAEERRNEGFATEAMRAVLGDLRARLAVDRVVAYIRLWNDASKRVATKLGMRVRGPGRARNGDLVEVWELRL